jgi:putative ABC transport system permease protein
MFRNYLKTAIRNITRHKGYSIINIVGLTFGLAAFWLIVLYVADELSYDRYNNNANRIYRVAQHASWNGNNVHIALTSAPFAPHLKTTFPEIEKVARINTEGGGVIEYKDKKITAGDIILADSSITNIFSYTFLYGNAATALQKPSSIILTETLANKIFGSTDKALDQTIYFDNNFPNTVTAVIKDIPANSHFRFSGIRSLMVDSMDGWQNANVYTYLLLRKGTDVKKLESKLPAFAATTVQKEMGIKDYHLELQPLTDIHLRSNLGYELGANGSINRVYIFMAIAALILLIAVINYMNLSTARSSSRVREVGVRKAIGSGKRYLTGMFITESVLVTLIAAVLSIVVATFSMSFFNQLTGKELSMWRFGIGNTLMVLTVFSFVVGIACGIYPSLFLSGFKTILALKGQMGNVSGTVLFRKSLVVLQFVITVVMITGSFVIYRQLQYALHTSLGFNKEQVLSFHIENRAVRSQMTALKQQLLQNPFIESAAAVGNPIGNNNLGGGGYFFEKSDGAYSDATRLVQQLMADVDFLKTMEIGLVAGRNFSDAFPADKGGSVLVNETLVKELGWKEPLGKHLTGSNSREQQPLTVIGVIKDFHTYSLQHKVEPLVVSMPLAAKDQDNVYVRIAKGKTTEALAYIDKVYRSFDKSSPVEYRFLDENFAQQYNAEKKQGQIALIFTVLAVLIASLGLLGLATFTAEQRKKEIGIRKVLGASVGTIVQMLSKDFLKLVAIAACISFPIAWLAMNHWLEGFAYRIDVSWWILLLSGVIAAVIALLTISVQALKAALANPVKSLRTE